MNIYARIIELDRIRHQRELTPNEASELIAIATKIAANDPSTGVPGTIDADSIIAQAGNVETGPFVKVDVPLVNNSEHKQRIVAALTEEHEARQRAIKVIAGILGAAAKAAI